MRAVTDGVEGPATSVRAATGAESVSLGTAVYRNRFAAGVDVLRMS